MAGRLVSVLVLLFFLCFVVAFVVVLAVAWLGGFREDEPYWTSGCVTPDETVMGVQGDEAALVDLETGRLTQRVEGYYEDVVCFPDNEVLALRGLHPLSEPEDYDELDDSVWLPSGRTVRGGIVVRSDVLGPVSDARFVSTSRDYELQDDDDPSPPEFSGPLYVETYDAGGRIVTSRGLGLAPDLFAGFEGVPVGRFYTEPIALLDDGRLLVSVGYRWRQHDEERWDIFAVDLGSAAATPYGSFGFDEAPGFGLSNASLSEDGGSLVFATFGEDAPEAVVRRLDGREDALALPLPEGMDTIQLALNADGSLLAVARLAEGEDPATIIEVYRVEGGQLLWEARAPGADTPYLVEFLEDDSLVVMTSDRFVFRRGGTDGRVLWQRAHNADDAGQ